MNDNRDKLHRYLSENVEGFNKSFDDFSSDMQDDEKRTKVHQYLSSNVDGFRKSLEDFTTDIANDPEVDTPVIDDTTPDESDDLNPVDNFLNFASNAITQTKQLPDMFALGLTQVKENMDGFWNFVANHTTRDTPRTEVGDESTRRVQEEVLGNIQERRGELKPTVSIVDAIEDKDALMTISSVLGSGVDAARSVATGIVSSGALPIAEMIGNSYTDALNEKSQETGIPVQQLIDEDQDDELVPITIGIMGGMLERVGLKGITKELLKKLPKDKLKAALSMAGTSGKEAITEWLQYGLEEGNKQVARTEDGALKESADFSNSFVNALYSKEGLNAFVTGAVGSGVITGSGVAIKKTRQYFTKNGEEVSRNEAKQLKENGEEVLVRGDEFLEDNSEQQEESTDSNSGPTEPEADTGESVESTDVSESESQVTEQDNLETTEEAKVDLETAKDEVINIQPEQVEEVVSTVEKVKSNAVKFRNWFNKDPELIGVNQAAEEYTSQVANDLSKQDNNVFEVKKLVKNDPEIEASINEFLEASNKKDAEAKIIEQTEAKGIDSKEVIIRLNRTRGIADNLSRFIAQSETFEFLSKNVERNRESFAQKEFKKPYNELSDEELGVVNDQVKDIRDVINNNIGSYLRTTYKVYSDKNYKITDDKKLKAVDGLLKEKLNILQTGMQKEGKTDAEIVQAFNDKAESFREEATEAINDYVIEVESAKNNTFGSFSDLSIPSSPFKQKKGVPEYISELLGERKDFAEKVMITTEALAQIKHRGIMSENLLKRFGDDFASTKKLSKDYEQVTSPTSPLQGMYINKEFKEIINPPVMDNNNLYYDALKWMRKFKTVYNAPTIRKNVTGQLFMQTMNGYGAAPVNTVKTLKDSISLYKRGGRTPESLNAIMDDMATAGLRSGDVTVGDLIRGEQYISGEGGKVINSIKKFDKAATKAYSGIDEIGKAYALISERERQAKLLYNKDYDQLSRAEQTASLKASGEIIKNTIPTWSRLPKIYNHLYRIPFGDFISFKLETLRTMANAHTMAYQYWGKANDKSLPDWQRKQYRDIATKRTAGLAINAGTHAGVAYGLGSFMGDDDSEEKKEVIPQLEAFKPDWMKGHTVLYKGMDKEGNVSVYNATMENPYGLVYDLFLNDSNFKGELADFITPNMLIQSATQVLSGKNHYGGDIFDDDDDSFDKTVTGLNHLFINGFMPPSMVSAVRKGSKKYTEGDFTSKDLGEVLWESSVIRDYEFNPGKTFFWRLKDYSKLERLNRVDANDMNTRIERLNHLKLLVKNGSTIDDKIGTSYYDSMNEALRKSRISRAEKNYIFGYANEDDLRNAAER